MSDFFDFSTVYMVIRPSEKESSIEIVENRSETGKKPVETHKRECIYLKFMKKPCFVDGSQTAFFLDSHS